MNIVPVFDLSTLLDQPQTDVQGDTFVDVHVTLPDNKPEQIPFVNADDHVPEYVKSWDEYVGQTQIKNQLRIHIDAAISRGDILDHILLASGVPGIGKTTLARLIAKELHARITMLVPPFSPQTLYDAAMSVDWGQVLFIDEIHKLADHGPAAAENLLHLLDERTLYLNDGIHHLNHFTVIGATTDADKLPETVVDRFPIKPYFQPYSAAELVRITKNFADFFDIGLRPSTMVAIAKACRGTPRVARELVIGARDIQEVTNEYVTAKDLLEFKEVDADGMTRAHKAYIKMLFQFFPKEAPTGGIEYIAGEASMLSGLRENKQGLARLERFLIESGLIDRTPRGRRLTPRGIEKARDYLTREGRLATL